MPPFSPAQPVLAFQLTFEGSWPTAVAFLGSARRLAAANESGQIFVWELPTEPPKPTPTGPKGKEPTAPNVWPVRQLVGHTNAVSRLAPSSDGKTLVSASFDRTVRIWPTDGSTAGSTEVVLDGDSRVRDARRAGKKSVPNAPGVTVAVQSASEKLDGHTDWVHALAVGTDRIVSGDAAGGVIVRDRTTHKTIAKWTGHPWNGIVSAALDPDARTALISEYRYKRDDFDIPGPGLKLLDTETGREQLDLLKTNLPKFDPANHTYGGGQVWRKFVGNGLIATAYSPDGKLVAAGQGGETDTGRVHLFETKTGKLVRTVSGHQYGVTDVLFTADSSHLISAGRDTCARIVRVADGRESTVLGSPRGGQFKDWFSAIALSPDQTSLAAADIAGLIHVWRFQG